MDILMNDINRKKNKMNAEMVDFPLNGAIHPSTVFYHQSMKELKKNQTNFNVKELIELLDVPRDNHFNKSYLKINNQNTLGQLPEVSKVPKGI